MTASRDRHRHQ